MTNTLFDDDEDSKQEDDARSTDDHPSRESDTHSDETIKSVIDREGNDRW